MTATRPNTRCTGGRVAALCVLMVFAAPQVVGGAQRDEVLAASVQARLHGALMPDALPALTVGTAVPAQAWLAAMSTRLATAWPERAARERLLLNIRYEATRAGLDPQLVLALIEVESAFRGYAISSAGAQGLMQVMPFWVERIGSPNDNLFDQVTNLRFGCVILRHYLDRENGDLGRALARYNGSLGNAQYPQQVRAAWLAWQAAAPRPTTGE